MISAENVQCADGDSVYNCEKGILLRTGPFMVLENPPMSGICDTLYFLDELGQPSPRTNGCGIEIKFEIFAQPLTNLCVGEWLYLIELKQDCFVDKPLVCPPVNPTSGLVPSNDGSWKCKFWVTRFKGPEPSQPMSIPSATKRTEDEFAKSNFQVFPNPAGDYLHLRSDAVVHKISILNVSNQHAQFERFGNGINITSLMPGLYFLKMETDVGPVTRKFIKE